MSKVIVFVGAHPDDDINAAGYLAQAAADGAHVVCVFLSRGEAGQMPGLGMDAALIRTAEQHAAAHLIGVAECLFLDHLGYRDGACGDTSPEPAILAIADLFTRLSPDVVITFDDGGLTGHDDHAVAGRIALEAVQRAAASCEVLQMVVTDHFADKVIPHLDRIGAMMNANRPRCVNLADAHLVLTIAGQMLDRKLEAYRAHGSQSLESRLGPALLDWLSHEAYVRV